MKTPEERARERELVNRMFEPTAEDREREAAEERAIANADRVLKEQGRG